jgi:hypothetical protein
VAAIGDKEIIWLLLCNICSELPEDREEFYYNQHYILIKRDFIFLAGAATKLFKTLLQIKNAVILIFKFKEIVWCLNLK